MKTGTVSSGKAYGQTQFIIRRIKLTLHEAGASLNDVVRTRLFVTDIDCEKR